MFLIILNVLPPSWLLRFFTFSRRTAFGRYRFIISATSKKRVPLVSSNPLWYPAMEKAWQGNPAQSRSKLWGIDAFVSSRVISPYGSHQSYKNRFLGRICLSQRRIRTPPTFWQARRNPPMPANRSMNLNLIFWGVGNGIFCRWLLCILTIFSLQM